MDPFPDFGLFELLAASGAAALARRIYMQRWSGFLFLVLSLIAPIALILIARGELVRWTAALCLATALVNAGLIFSLMRDGRLSGADHEP